MNKRIKNKKAKQFLKSLETLGDHDMPIRNVVFAINGELKFAPELTMDIVKSIHEDNKKSKQTVSAQLEP
jgi:hypothetical protein